ncbi:hypothetical protein AFLA_009335 [Aspergillus flavus NRRL3357]|nr:hypothetical protein AFLA_009335 [Aspergillus flavus NRRL3357]
MVHKSLIASQEHEPGNHRRRTKGTRDDKLTSMSRICCVRLMPGQGPQRVSSVTWRPRLVHFNKRLFVAIHGPSAPLLGTRALPGWAQHVCRSTFPFPILIIIKSTSVYALLKSTAM